jgi:hypothetical protein
MYADRWREQAADPLGESFLSQGMALRRLVLRDLGDDP